MVYSKVILVIFAAVIFYVVGCDGGVVCRTTRLELTGIEVSRDVSDLSAVLSQVVDARGRLIISKIDNVEDRLIQQLKRMAITGPTTSPELFPDEISRLVYWYNARIAWSIRLAQLSLGNKVSRGRDIFRCTFQVDGRIMSLDQIDSLLLSYAKHRGDFRIAACIPGVRAGYAPLPTKPFSPEKFNAELSEQLNRLVLDEERFVIDVMHRRVVVPPMLWACRDMIISEYQRRFGRCEVKLLTAMGVHLNSQARFRLEKALGYRVIPRRNAGKIITQPRKVYYPGKVGKIEL